MRAVSNILLSSILASILVSGCASTRSRAQAVVVTANPRLVEPCTRVGLVARGSVEELRSDELFALQVQALQRDANTVVIPSITSTGSGTAYSCDPPLSQDQNMANAVSD